MWKARVQPRCLCVKSCRKALLCFFQENVRYSSVRSCEKTLWLAGFSVSEHLGTLGKVPKSRGRTIAQRAAPACLRAVTGVYQVCKKKSSGPAPHLRFWVSLNVRDAVFSRSGLPGGFGKLLATVSVTVEHSRIPGAQSFAPSPCRAVSSKCVLTYKTV